MYKDQAYKLLLERFRGERRFIQVLSGPRETGKTTLVRKLLDEIALLKWYVTAEGRAGRDLPWLEMQWRNGRAKVEINRIRNRGLLVIEEIERIPGWAETVQRLWDEDTAAGMNLHVLVVGSSSLSMEQGLTENLAGRFELIPITPGLFPEMAATFGMTLNQYLYYGGYPEGADLMKSPKRWIRYINDLLVETSISRDILQTTRVDKPSLLHDLLAIACDNSCQILSYRNLLARLPAAGNTTTLAHYLRLLQGAGLAAGLPKYAGPGEETAADEGNYRQRGSSPKLLALNTALITARADQDFDLARTDPDLWGRVMETAVGAHCIHAAAGTDISVYYWAGQNREVDFVLARGKELAALEVVTDRRKQTASGLELFCRLYPVQRRHIIGLAGLPLDAFFRTPLADLF